MKAGQALVLEIYEALASSALLRIQSHAIRAMPERGQRAPHLGKLLEAEPRSDLGSRAQLHEEMSSWRTAARHERRGGAGGPSESSDGAGHRLDLHEFQEEFVKFAMAMRDAGLPPGQP